MRGERVGGRGGERVRCRGEGVGRRRLAWGKRRVGLRAAEGRRLLLLHLHLLLLLLLLLLHLLLLRLLHHVLLLQLLLHLLLPHLLLLLLLLHLLLLLLLCHRQLRLRRLLLLLRWRSCATGREGGGEGGGLASAMLAREERASRGRLENV